LFLYVVARTVIGLAALYAAPGMLRLTIGWAGPQMTEPGARSEAWSDPQRSLIGVSAGLSLLGILESRGDGLWRLVGVPLLAFTGWDLVSPLRARMSGKPGSDTGEVASGPDTSARGGQPHRPELPWPAEGASAEAEAEWVDRKIFSTTRLRPGYDEEEVDVFLDAIRDTFLG
jgi:DivIVA domain-containing protein